MQILRNKRYGLQDIYALPDGRRDELLDGQLCMMASPTTTRQRILNFVSIEIYLYLRNNKGECEVYPAPFAAFPDADAEKYLNDARFPDCSCEISYRFHIRTRRRGDSARVPPTGENACAFCCTGIFSACICPVFVPPSYVWPDAGP